MAPCKARAPAEPGQEKRKMQTNETASQTSPLALIAFWLYVGIPLIWGVSSTLHKAMALFN
jgi:hypothetical protein